MARITKGSNSKDNKNKHYTNNNFYYILNKFILQLLQIQFIYIFLCSKFIFF